MSAEISPIDATSLRVIPHAIQRFRDRANKVGSDEALRAIMIKMANEGREMVLKKKFRVIALINNNFRDARYIKHGRFILVIEGDQITTIHDGAADRWEYPL